MVLGAGPDRGRGLSSDVDRPCGHGRVDWGHPASNPSMCPPWLLGKRLPVRWVAKDKMSAEQGDYWAAGQLQCPVGSEQGQKRCSISFSLVSSSQGSLRKGSCCKKKCGGVTWKEHGMKGLECHHGIDGNNPWEDG